MIWTLVGFICMALCLCTSMVLNTKMLIVTRKNKLSRSEKTKLFRRSMILIVVAQALEPIVKELRSHFADTYNNGNAVWLLLHLHQQRDR